jgi:hypothetical protein
LFCIFADERVKKEGEVEEPKIKIPPPLCPAVLFRNVLSNEEYEPLSTLITPP